MADTSARPSMSLPAHLQDVRARALRYWGQIKPHLPLSVAGVLILCTALLALRGFGYARMDLVVFALTVCALAIVGFSLVAVTLTGLWLRRRTRQLLQQPLPSLQAEATYANDTGLALPAFGWLPLMNLHWQVTGPDTMLTQSQYQPDTGLVEEVIVPTQRCVGQHLTRLFTLRDVLGLCRFSWRVSQPASITVLPVAGNLRHLPLLRSMDADDGLPNLRGRPEGDRMDIRRYAPGDSTRDIMWRVYARNRHLNVRLPERSQHHTERTLAYLLSGNQDEAAAGAARVALETQALGENWLFGADGSTTTSRQVGECLQMIARSRQPGQRISYGLDTFLDQQGGNRAACVVFAPACPGDWYNALLTSMARYQASFTVVLATDSLQEGPDAPRWQRWLLQQPAAPRQRSLTELKALAAGLTKAGAQVLIVDRQSGQSFDQRLKRV